MLTLFVAKSHARNASFDRAVAGFKSVTKKVFHVEHNDINRIPVFTKWYGVIYDDEEIDRQLADALSGLLVMVQRDVMVCFKNDKTKAPRFFKSHVRLQPDSLLPLNPALKFEYIGNGQFRRQARVEG